jgi:TM2 domain-containing membrane protein YozV
MIERTDDPEQIEHRLLELVYTTDAPITAPALAYFAPCSLEAAEAVLDKLVARDRLHMEVGDDGAITYTFPHRHKFAPPSEPLPPPPALVPHRPLPLAIRGGRQASPLLAATLSLLIPGAGQLYTGNALSAILWFALVTAGYTLILPGIFLHLFCIASAAGAAYRLNSSLARLALERS